MSPKVEKISEQTLLLGEGPHWDDRSQALYFVSILENTIHKYDSATGIHTSTTLEGRPGFIVPLDGHLDQFVVGLEREFVVIQWDGANAASVVRLLGEVDQHSVGNRINHGKTDPRGRLYALAGFIRHWVRLLGDVEQAAGAGNRINDGKADPSGRLYAGTMDGATNMDKIEAAYRGTLYRLDESGITALFDKITISNGLAWDAAAKAMYYIVSVECNIRRYDYDADTGDISNPQHIFDLKQHDVIGLPDGCTIDTDGNLWVAVFGGGCVIQVSPEGKLLRAVPVPARQVTSCTFGGPDLDILFVTTARLNTVEDQEFPSGCTFRITGLGVKGHRNMNFKL